MPSVSHPAVAFHGFCRICDSLAPLAVLNRTGQTCEDCIERGLTRKPLATIRIHRNSSATIKERPKRIYKGTKGSKATKNRAKAARIAALKRLQLAFPEIYRLLYAEERARRGLPAVTFSSKPDDPDARERALRAAGERFSLDGIYDALAEAGIEEP